MNLTDSLSLISFSRTARWLEAIWYKMGTLGGVALSKPRRLSRLSALADMDRFAKPGAVLRRDRAAFLEAGDVVVVRGAGLGEVETKVEDPAPEEK